MREERPSSSEPEHPSLQNEPTITLFGKRMEMKEPGTETETGPGYDTSSERRVFWLIVIVFAVVLVTAFFGAYFWRSKPAAAPSRGSSPRPPAAAPAAAPAVQPAPTPAASAPTPPAASAPAPPAARTESTASHKPETAPRSGPARRARAEVKARAKARPAAKAAKPAPVQPSSPDKKYVQQLRERMLQYDRDKARGKYQEFPK